MSRPIKKRIAKLREEISQISEANREYLRGGKKPIGAPNQERRLQSCRKILDELMSLTDWNKP